jgi:uncharacterized C2H2 Zn-finger protein
VSLEDYLDRRLGVHSGHKPELMWNCPACIDRLGSESQKPKLAVNIDKRVGHCWRCGFAFRSLAVLFRYMNDGKLFSEEIDLLHENTPPPPRSDLKATVFGIVMDQRGEETILRPVPLPPEMLRLSDDRASRRTGVNAAHKYLKGRGVGLHLDAEFNIGYCPTGRYANRLIFPIYQGGRCVYFTTRSVADDFLKTLNPKGDADSFTKSDCLLHYDDAVGSRVVVVVEGPFDCMAFSGVAKAVALMGKTISLPQLKLIDSLRDEGLEEVVVCLDAGAMREAEVIYRTLLNRVPEVSVITLPSGDPHDNRKNLPALMGAKGQLSLKDRVLGRLKK